MSAHPDNLVDWLRHHASRRPDDLYARYLFTDRDPIEVSFGETRLRAQAFAHLYASSGVRAGDLVLVILRHHPDLMAAFLGAMWLGAVPAFLPAPTPRLDPRQYSLSLARLFEASRPTAVLTHRDLRDWLGRRFAARHQPEVLVRDDAPLEGASADPTPSAATGPALIQYSSGSTGLQKGAILSHRAILAEIEGVGEFFEIGRRDSLATWIPLYHDWGLVCVALHALVLGTSFTLLSPIDWVTDPALIFEAIDRFRPTIYYQPNFAFNFLTQRVRNARMKGIDLSSLRLCCNGAEPCLYDSHRMFVERFSAWGLRSDSLAIVYGMAEVTNSVFAAGLAEPIVVDTVDRDVLQRDGRARPVTRDHPRAVNLLSVGRPLRGTELQIVDDKRRTLPERAVGEVAIRSRAAFSGYWGNPAATAACLDADGWYFSGDLGYRVDNRLYITGRKSDLIIIGGVNIYPQDVEGIAAEHPQVVAGRVAAVGVENSELGTQQLVVLLESRSEDPKVQWEISQFLRRQVAQRLNVVVDRVVHLPRRWLHKTSSGKIARLPNLERLQAETGGSLILDPTADPTAGAPGA